MWSILVDLWRFYVVQKWFLSRIVVILDFLKKFFYLPIWKTKVQIRRKKVTCQLDKQGAQSRWPQGSIFTFFSLSSQILHISKVVPISQYSSYCSGVTWDFYLIKKLAYFPQFWWVLCQICLNFYLNPVSLRHFDHRAQIYVLVSTIWIKVTENVFF